MVSTLGTRPNGLLNRSRDSKCNLFIFGMPGTLETGRLELTRMEAEYEKLTNDLHEWHINVPTHHPRLGTELTAQVRAQEQVKRLAFKELLEGCWRRETAIGGLLTKQRQQRHVVKIGRHCREIPQ